MKKKILILSHERSGTHFLINTLAQCFDYSPQQVDMDNSQNIDWENPRAVTDWLQQFRGRCTTSIFKSHHASPFLEPLIPELSEDYHIFYIQRDGRDVMTSFWVYLNRLAPGWGPATGTVGEFMRASAVGGIAQYQRKQQEMTMLQRWVDHVKGWSRPGLPIHRISYEELHANHRKTVDRIALILGQPAASDTRPGLDSPSSLPWRGNTGTWKEFFTAEDLAYYEEQTRSCPHP